MHKKNEGRIDVNQNPISKKYSEGYFSTKYNAKIKSIKMLLLHVNFTNKHIHKHIHTYIYIPHIYIYTETLLIT